jgi:FkbM family methyltransferase
MFLFGDKVRYNIVVPCDQGTFIVNRFDYTTMPTGEKVGQGQWLMDHGNVSTPEAMLTGERLKDTKAPVIFDIGANIGTYSTLIGTIIPSSTIYAFEPQRLVFQQFCGNMAINNLDNVYAYNIALSDTNETMVVEEPDPRQIFNFGGYSLAEDQNLAKSRFKSNIELITLDSFVEKNSIDKIDFIKIDAEGMDLKVLQGAKATIDIFKPMILVEWFNGRDDSKQILTDELSKYGFYNIEVHGNNLLAIPN